MKLTDDIFVKGFLNEFNKKFDEFLKMQNWEESENIKGLIAAKSSALDLFNKDSDKKDLSSVLLNVSTVIKDQLNAFDSTFYSCFDEYLSTLRARSENDDLDLNDEGEEDDDDDLFNGFPNRLHSLKLIWDAVEKRAEKVLSNPSDWIRASDLWMQQQPSNPDEEEKPSMSRRMTI